MIETAQISIEGNEQNVTIKGSGALDLTNSCELKDTLASVSKTAETLEVDLRGAEFVDTAILEYLARAARQMLAREKRLKVLVAEGSHPQRVLRIAGFGGLMDITAEPAPIS